MMRPAISSSSTSQPMTTLLSILLLSYFNKASVSAEIRNYQELTLNQEAITDQKHPQNVGIHNQVTDLLKDEDEYWFNRELEDITSLQEIPATSSPTTLSPSTSPSASPSMRPTGCSYLIEECPTKCWEANENSRPPTCSSITAIFPFLRGCNSLPFDFTECPECCPDECLDENRDREGCDPTPVPSPAPSPVPSSAPTATPTGCSYLIDECPFSCWEIDENSRPPTCSSIGATFPILQGCNSLPFDYSGCPECCPDECLVENRDREGCDPTPLPSPAPSTSPTSTPSSKPTSAPSPLPSPGPSPLPSPEPSPLPSMMPSKCSELIESCPHDSCFLPHGDPSRPLDCIDPRIDRPECDAVPPPEGIACPVCCASDCRSDHPMFSLSPNGSPPECSPTMVPSPSPSSVPSPAPTPCMEILENCPAACFSSDMEDHPPSCIQVQREDCNHIPIPDDCPICCPTFCHTFDPDHCGAPTPVPSPQPSSIPSPSPTFIPSTVPSTTPTSSPSSEPSSTPSSEPTVGAAMVLETQRPSNKPSSTPSSTPTDLPSPIPSPAPSPMPSECTFLIDECPALCFQADAMERHPPCIDFNRPDCDVLPFDEVNCPRCCPSECDGAQDREDCSPTPLPSQTPSSDPSSKPSIGPTSEPSSNPSSLPSSSPTLAHSRGPSSSPSMKPSESPSASPSHGPSNRPSESPSSPPSPAPSARPTTPGVIVFETQKPSNNPSMMPSSEPSHGPTPGPAAAPSPVPSSTPTDQPSSLPSPPPSPMPTSCTYLIEECPVVCFDVDPTMRYPPCADFGRPDCDILPFDNEGCPRCCPAECNGAQDREDCSPTPLPSPNPSSKPSFIPSTEPSETPSDTPTACSHLIEECPVTCWEIDPNNRPESCTTIGNTVCNVLPLPYGINCECCPDECLDPQERINCSPTPIPSARPSLVPSTADLGIILQTAHPSKSPSSMPSEEPSAMPSTVHSIGPSVAVSGVPSIIPTFMPWLTESQGCGLDISIDDSCLVACDFDVCVERPYRMQMIYTGGGCEGTSFKRCPGEDPDACACTKEDVSCTLWNQNNSCRDFDTEGNVCNNLQQTCEGGATIASAVDCGPPPSNVDHKVFIEAFGGDELYFEGPVSVNSTWDALTRQAEVEAYTDIFTYDWDDDTGKGRLLQHVAFDSSCTEELVLADQFGCHQLQAMDSYCQPSCNDGGCIDVTEDGLTFGRRRMSLLMETEAQLRLDKVIGSIARSATEESVQLEHVLGLYTPVDFSSPGVMLNFSEAIGQIVPPSIELSQDGLIISAQKNYSVATIVTGFLDGDRSSSCQQIAESQIGCRRVPQLPCQCPPCLATQLSSLPPAGSSPSGDPPTPTAPLPAPTRPTASPPTPSPTTASIILSTASPTRGPQGESGKAKSKDGKSGKSVGKSNEGKTEQFGKSWMSNPGKSGSGKNKSTKGGSGKSGKSDDSGKSGKSNSEPKSDTGKASTGKSAKDNDSGKSDSSTGKSNKGKTEQFGKSWMSNPGKSGSGKSKSTKGDSGKAGKADDSGKSGKSNSDPKSDAGKASTGKSAGKNDDSGKSDSSGKSNSAKQDTGKSSTGKSGKSNDSGKSDSLGKSNSGKLDTDKGSIGKSGGKNDDSGTSDSSGKSNSAKQDTGKASTGKSAGKNDDAGKSNSSGKSNSAKQDTGKASTGKSAAKNDDAGKSNSSGKSNSAKQDTGKASTGKSAGKNDDTGKSNSSGKSNSAKQDTGKTSTGKSTGKNEDSGKSDSSGKSNSANQDTGKSSTGKSAGKHDDSGKSNSLDKSNSGGKQDTGKASTGNSGGNNGDSGKASTGKSAGKKGDSGKSASTSSSGKSDSLTGKWGKWAGKSGQNDGGAGNQPGKTGQLNDSGTTSKGYALPKGATMTPPSAPNQMAVTLEAPNSSPANIAIVSPVVSSPSLPPAADATLFSTLLPTGGVGVQQMAAQPMCDLDITFMNQCAYQCRHEVCKETPYRMQMRYNGGGCYGMSFKRCLGDNPDYCSCDKEELPCSGWKPGNVCADFTQDGRVCNSHSVACADQDNKDPTPGCGPPASTEAHMVYIEAYGENELYFAGPVSVNSTWEATTEGERMSSNTAIFTYEWTEGTGKGRILQQVLLQSACSDTDMSAGDQFGSQQLVEFDSFCDISCSDGGCKEVTEYGTTFGRRRISMYLEDVSSVRVDLGVGSLHNNVELEHILAMYTPSDFSSPTQVFNFSEAMGATVPSMLQLDVTDLELEPEKEYSVATIVTGFINGDRAQVCQQIAMSQLSCDKRATLQCRCPPCAGAEMADIFGLDVSTEGSNPSPTSPSKAPSKSPPASKGSGKNNEAPVANPNPPSKSPSKSPPSGKSPKEPDDDSTGKDVKKRYGIADGK